MNIETELEALLRREGGYVNHPADRGGETNWGITIAVARANGYTGAMRQLPRETAKAIYRKQYWTAPKIDKVATSAPRAAAKLFDIAVNMGPGRAVRMLQRALNYFRGGVAVDGQIGGQTLGALDAFVTQRGPGADSNLAKLINAYQAVRYSEIVEGDSSQRAFAYGWINGRVQ